MDKNKKLICYKCKVEIKPGRTYFDYLGHSFHTTCPDARNAVRCLFLKNWQRVKWQKLNTCLRKNKTNQKKMRGNLPLIFKLRKNLMKFYFIYHLFLCILAGLNLSCGSFFSAG